MINQPSTQPPEAMGGAVPQSQAMGGQSPKLTPEQMASLRQDPDISQAVEMVLGKKIDLKMIPDDLLVNIAGMVHKLGVQGAVQEFTKKVPPQVLQQLKQGL